MSDNCPHCNGSYWILGQRELGPCVCVTPEGMAALEERRRNAFLSAEEAYTAEGVENGETVAEAATALSSYLVSLGLAANPLRAPDNEHLARLTELLL